MKLYKIESYIIVVVVLITVLLNLTTFLYRSFTTPEDKYFAGTQFYSDDYAVYVSYIKQGQEGRWTTTDKFTSEPHPSSLVHEEYLLWGKLTGFFGIQPVLAYHLSRLLFGLLFLVAIYLLLLKITPGTEHSFLRIASFVLICFGAGFLGKNGQPYLSWLTEMDVTQKFGLLLHYLLGFICMLGVFLLTYSFRPKLFNYLVLFILGAVGSFVLPAAWIVAVTAIITTTLLQPAQERNKMLLPVVVFTIAGIPATIYFGTIFNIPPWSHILAWEKINRAGFTLVEYVFALGPMALLAPLGISAIKISKKAVVFLAAWVLSVFLWAFLLADIFGLNPTRFLQNPVYIPLSVMTILGLNTIFKKNSLVLLVVVLVISLSLPVTIKSLTNHLRMYSDFSELIYPGTDLTEAFSFLDKNTQPEETVISLYLAGNLTPFLAGNTVFLGHLQETMSYDEKVKQAEVFYSGSLTEVQAREFLANNHISLVFYSPQEKMYGRIEKYRFLKQIYKNGTIDIFRFSDE